MCLSITSFKICLCIFLSFCYLQFLLRDTLTVILPSNTIYNVNGPYGPFGDALTSQRGQFDYVIVKKQIA